MMNLLCIGGIADGTLYDYDEQLPYVTIAVPLKITWPIVPEELATRSIETQIYRVETLHTSKVVFYFLRADNISVEECISMLLSNYKKG